ncbi:HSP40/DnaJ peptide-binding [Sesbania bispinosa]|nr:HSP40/DnaJ peptide-binding [Sesbania bispinosa]
MGDQRSPTLDLHHIFKIPKTKSLKDVSKVYKSFVSKRHHDKKSHEEPITPPSFEYNNKRVDEDIWSPKFLSRTKSRRSKTPTPKSRPLSRHSSRRCTTPTILSRTSSRKSAAEIATSSLKRIMSRRGSSASLSRTMSRLDISEPEIIYHAGSPINDLGTRSYREPDHHIPAVSLSSNLSRRATTPIIFSQTTARRKPPEVEKKLHCTLEELCFGCTKKLKVTRDVIKHPGVIIQEEEILKIEVKPGWRKGTKITFEGVGDESPGYLPADIVFLVDEKKHPLFMRDGNDLEICLEIPLVDALTGCSIPIPLLGGENMTLSFENTVIYPGYEKVIKGQGMPNPKNNGTRGDLHVKFLIDFPTELSDEQREEAVSILQDCC